MGKRKKAFCGPAWAGEATRFGQPGGNRPGRLPKGQVGKRAAARRRQQLRREAAALWFYVNRKGRAQGVHVGEVDIRRKLGF